MLLSDLLYYVKNLKHYDMSFEYVEIYLNSEDFKSIFEQNNCSKCVCPFKSYIMDEKQSPLQINHYYKPLKMNFACIVFNFIKEGVIDIKEIQIVTETERIIKNIIE